MQDSFVLDDAFRSRQKMYRAFLSTRGMREGRPLTVSALCQTSGVSRATFYRHFDGIDGFLSRFLDDLQAETCVQSPVTLSLFQALTLQEDRLLRDEELRAALMGPSVRPALLRVAEKRTFARLQRAASLKAKGPKASDTGTVSSPPPVFDEELMFFAEAVAATLPPLLLLYADSGKLGGQPMFASLAASVVPERLFTAIGDEFL